MTKFSYIPYFFAITIFSYYGLAAVGLSKGMPIPNSPFPMTLWFFAIILLSPLLFDYIYERWIKNEL